jgi:hypothetical protein
MQFAPVCPWMAFCLYLEMYLEMMVNTEQTNMFGCPYISCKVPLVFSETVSKFCRGVIPNNKICVKYGLVVPTCCVKYCNL